LAKRARRSSSGRCRNNDLILGAIGQLQFEVVAFRLRTDIQRALRVRGINVFTGAGIACEERQAPRRIRAKAYEHLSIDHSGALVYVARRRVNLQLRGERWPGDRFPRKTRDHLARAA